MKPPTDTPLDPPVIRFGVFELDFAASRLLKNGRTVRLQPQPFKLLCLLARRPGQLVTREDIRSALWPDDTYVDFDQGVNFAVKHVRDALNDDAEHSLYIQTVPKRGYRFVAPVDSGTPEQELAFWPGTDPSLHKALWANIAELRMAEARRKEQRKKLQTTVVSIAGVIVIALALVLFFLRR
jgi:DNA-binding winged helix-turn-helix (wHTH) protein